MQEGRRDIEKALHLVMLALGCSHELSQGGQWLPSSDTLSETLGSCLLRLCQKMQYLLPKIPGLVGMSVHIVEILTFVFTHQSFCS